MEWLFWILVIAAAVVAVWYVVSAGRRNAAKEAARLAAGSGDMAGVDRLRPRLADFHVSGEEALVAFDVPLPPGGADEVLRDLLVSEAVEVMHDKRRAGLPIDQVTVVRAFGDSDGERVEVGSIELEEPGVLPELAAPDLVPHASVAGYDPLAAAVGEGLPEHTPGLAEAARSETLGSIGEELRIPDALAAGLRTQGLDPATMSAGELVIGLLRLTGFAVSAGPKPGTHFADRAGSRTFLLVVDHEPGAHPELDERKVREFMVGFGESGAQRGLLVTDKFGPFEVYNRERREPRVRFLTRERLQGFVDAVSVG